MTELKCGKCGCKLPRITGSLYVKALGMELCSDCLRAYYRKDVPLYRLANMAEDFGIPRSTIDCIIADADDDIEEY